MAKRPTKKAPAEAGASPERSLRTHQFDRLVRWANSRPPGEVAVHFAGLVMLRHSHRKQIGQILETFDALASYTEGVSDDVAELMADLRKNQRGRADGARKRWESDPTQAAKATARDLWPAANRNGWTAPRFHRAIVDAGHDTPFDTARKWLTKLRQTGKC